LEVNVVVILEYESDEQNSDWKPTFIYPSIQKLFQPRLKHVLFGA
jgi:hypothetical protein